MTRRRRVVGLLAIGLLSGTAVLGYFAGRILKRDDGRVRADAIVILAGEFPTRAMEAGLLHREGIAPRVITTHEQLGDGIAEARALGLTVASLDERNRELLEQLGVPAQAILSYPEITMTTRDEVQAVRRLLAREPAIRSILLVTNGYHTRRARRLFARCLPGIAVSVTVPREDRYDAEHWWRHPWNIRATTVELPAAFQQLFVSCPPP
jgi:uncharacterized SAM-binding protein YcdF (DUF218 family)